jgi:hypothetical protein
LAQGVNSLGEESRVYASCSRSKKMLGFGIPAPIWLRCIYASYKGLAMLLILYNVQILTNLSAKALPPAAIRYTSAWSLDQ